VGCEFTNNDVENADGHRVDDDDDGEEENNKLARARLLSDRAYGFLSSI
jgi:hypothetical protein